MIKGMSQGMVARISRCISTPWLLDTTNKIMPMGGVSVPIINVKIMFTPKYTGSMLNCSAKGMNEGTSTSSKARTSIKQPRINSNTVTANMNSVGVLATDISSEAICSGAFSRAITTPIIDTPPMIRPMVDDMTAVS